jgi:hypothetical protein
MSKNGVLLFARNNSVLDYVKQAIFLAGRIKTYLNIPTSIVTDSTDYLINQLDGESIFDEIIPIPFEDGTNKRFYFDGTLTHKRLSFKNDFRASAYDLSPYDNTLLMDTDYIISNSLFKSCFTSNENIMMFKESYDLSDTRDKTEFDFVSDCGVDFWWATVVFFKKCESSKILFDLISHVSDNWSYYRRLYQIQSPMFRNDFAFSIAIHILNGLIGENSCVAKLPGKHYYTIDKDLLVSIDDDYLSFLVERKDYLGEYLALSTKGQSVHVMNKFSLERVLYGRTF